jgi:peroxiredoxin
VTAIGTGGKRYAEAFIADESVPFPVLLDEDGEAAGIAGTNTLGLTTLLKPKAYTSAVKSFAAGNRQTKTGKRPLQLGATFVIAPGDVLVYADFEDFAGDHAPLDDVLEALR